MTVLRPAHPPGATLEHIAELTHGSLSPTSSDVFVTGIEVNSSAIQRGDLFVALPGARAHGATYAKDALSRGALAILTDKFGEDAIGGLGIPYVVCDTPRADLGLVSATIYGSADPQRRTFGVTGTNGKTSVSYCLSAILQAVGVSTALSTTADRRIGARDIPSDLTTPEAPQLHAFLAVAREEHVEAAVLEVSAHALTRHRVDGIAFDVVGFTNFSHDHLDDYDTLDDYFAAKCELFTRRMASRAVICVDDEWGRRLVAKTEIPVVTIASSSEVNADWYVDIVSESMSKTEFRVRSSDWHLDSSVPLVGGFMGLNAALAIVMAIEAGIEREVIASSLDRSGGVPVDVPGRLEVVSGPVGPVFVVDYGHTPEAFRSSLEALRRLTPGRLVMVFGADGDRDTIKRSELGAISARLADTVIVTDYHPRTEDPASIRGALIAGARSARPDGDIREVPDPGEAIRQAIDLSHAGDVILYAGPGHEKYREVSGHKIPFDAREVVRTALREAGYPTGDAP